MAEGANGRIRSLQALRAIAFLGIFLSHVGFSYSWAGLAVSIFFVLSGFLLALRHGQQPPSASLRGCAGFAWQHVKRIYLLHIVCAVLFAFLRLVIEMTVGLKGETVLEVAGLLALNGALLQSWVPDQMINISLNGVAWFLSASVFLYFIFPLLIRGLSRLQSRALTALGLLMPVIQIAAYLPILALFRDQSRVCVWFSYCFPVFRLGDFTAGCCLGLLYARAGRRQATRVTAAGTLLELAALALTVGEAWLRRRPYGSLFVTACFNNSSLYIWLALLWVYVFAARAGALTRLLDNHALAAVGDVSMYAYLIHFLLIQYVYNFSQLIRFSIGGPRRVPVILLELALSLLLAAGYRRLAAMSAQLKA